MSYDLFNFQNEANTGQVTMLAPMGESEVRSNRTRGSQPKSRIYDRWQWISGISPQVSVANGAASASGSEMVIHAIRDAEGKLVRWRVIVIETTDVATLKDAAGGVLQTPASGQYADLFVNVFNEITGSTSPLTFDRNTTAGSEGILDEVDVAKAEVGLPIPPES